MLGDKINVDFMPSNSCRGKESLKRWGYKIKIKPVYGYSKFIFKENLF